MKKILTVIGMLLVFPSLAWAGPIREGKWDAALDVAGRINTDDGISSGVYVGGELVYGMNSWFGLGLSSGWADSSFDFNSVANGRQQGGMRANPVRALISTL